jgi:hypothetical protein
VVTGVFQRFAKRNNSPTCSSFVGVTTASGGKDSFIPSKETRRRSSSVVDTASPKAFRKAAKEETTSSEERIMGMVVQT